MKKLLILGVVALSGCSTLVDAYLMKYDPIEYELITNIRTQSSFAKSNCEKEEESKNAANSLAKESAKFKNYVEYLPHNDKVIAASKELNDMVKGVDALYQKGKVSPTFCKIKFDGIEKSAESMQKTIGAKPR